MTKAGERLIKSLEEALAIAKGEAKAARIHKFQEIKCAACAGLGERWVTTHALGINVKWKPCPSCDGKGYILMRLEDE